jgi:soluble lytic murein transglycosylase
VEALRGGDWQEAARGFRAEAPGAGLLADYAQFLLAESLLRTGELAAARRAADALLERQLDGYLAPRSILLAADLAARQGDEPAAAAMLRRFLARFSDRADAARARYLLGLSLEAQGRTLEAARSFRELWLTAPASPYGEAAGDRLALLALTGVVLPPPTALERLERAERLQAGGQLPPAREEAEALLAELPDPDLTLRGLRVLAGAWKRGGRYDAAVRAVERALPDAGEARRASLLLALARLQQRVGAREGALATLERLMREAAAAAVVAKALVLRGRLLEDAGRAREAEAAYRRVIDEVRDAEATAVALWRLGWLAYLRLDLTTAAAEFGRLGGLSGLYRAPALYWAGRAREALGHATEAQRLYAVLLAEVPRSYYGILAGQRRRGTAPVAARAPALTLPPDPLRPVERDPRFLRVAALRAVGLSTFAVDELEEALSRVLSEPLKLYALAAAFVREERYHLALRILRHHFSDLASTGDPSLPKAFWQMLYPVPWERELGEAADRTGVDRFLLAALVREESNFFPAARSRVGARGLAQLMPDTARALALRRGLAFGDGALLDEPAPNLQLGAAYLAGLLREFPDPRLAAAAYNAGPARVREWWAARRSDDVELWVEQIPFDETRHFVKRVIVSWEEYRRVYGRDRAPRGVTVP